MTFSLIDVILILAAGQGIFLLFYITTNKKRNPYLNFLLTVILSIAVIVLLGRLLRYRVEGSWYFYLATFIDTSIFVFGPLGFLLIKKMYFKEKSRTLEFWHFIPAGLHLLYACWVLFQPITAITTLYKSGGLRMVYFTIELSGITSMVTYHLLTLRLWLRYEQQIKYVISYEQGVKNFTIGFLSIWGAFNFIWFIQFLMRSTKVAESYVILQQIRPYFSYINLWIVICLAIYVLSYASLRIPEVFQLPQDIRKKKENFRLSVAESARLKKRLDFFLIEEKIYLDPELTRAKLARKVDISANDLSWLLNTIFKKTFYEYVNQYRVNEVKEKIKNGEHEQLTLLAIAFDAGFKSKSTFNKVFKTQLGMSPSMYADSQKVA